MTHVEHARTFPVTVEAAYAVVAPVPLEEVLGRRHLAIPGVARVEQSGPWVQEVGQRRTLHFTDGGRTTEVLTVLDAPHRFGYELADVAGPMKLLVAAVDGLWVFVPDGSGTRITWSWEIRPTLPGRLVMPAFTRMWHGMAARCFDRLGERMSGSS
ncbi:SRPBCC family protein [Nocardioides sp.]|uniref:SRPBCC family protein n=1 Tax=Nocardioides sp. TaxID=35761 RepID=UPI002717692E|nr:SRPBCC family protein [Nocardioides sp.]MDO9456887.1 SRPBCC family protein [Nocardioides sp.]